MIHKKHSKLIPFLILGIITGIIIGSFIPESFISFILSIKHILGEYIFFTVPLIILGFITPAIIQMKQKAGTMLGTLLILAYLSSIGAAFMAMYAGYKIIPHFLYNITITSNNIKILPNVLFTFDIPPVFSVLTALTLSIIFGIGINSTNCREFEKLFTEFHDLMYLIIQKTVIPILPIFIASTFVILTYEGTLIKQLPIFLKVIGIVIVGHYVWLTLLYGIAGLVSGKNPWLVVKHYLPAYLTALGTMSSAATLPVAIAAAKESSVLEEKIVDFVIPLGATIHLCGSVLTEVFFIMTVSQVLYGSLPDPTTLSIFILSLGVFAIGAPGIPGGTVIASLGLISSILKFDATGIALVVTIFTLQDSFGTACNITGDGALALMLTPRKKHQDRK